MKIIYDLLIIARDLTLLSTFLSLSSINVSRDESSVSSTKKFQLYTSIAYFNLYLIALLFGFFFFCFFFLWCIFSQSLLHNNYYAHVCGTELHFLLNGSLYCMDNLPFPKNKNALYSSSLSFLFQCIILPIKIIIYSTFEIVWRK